MLQLDVLDHLRLRMYGTDAIPQQFVEHGLQRDRDGRQDDHNNIYNRQSQFPDLQRMARADRLREDLAKDNDKSRGDTEPY